MKKVHSARNRSRRYSAEKTRKLSIMAIEHKRLGKHGVFVSNICLGTMNFGWHTAQEESFKIMDRALARLSQFLTRNSRK